jgi:hypothetical protein
MNADQAQAVAADMERHGYNTMTRLGGGKWVVKAIDAGTGNEVTIRAAVEWDALKGEAAPVTAAAGMLQAALL